MRRYTVLTKFQQKLLAIWREDNQAAGFPFAPTAYWSNVNSQFDEWFRKHGIDAVETQYYNEHFSGIPPSWPAIPTLIQNMGGGGCSLTDLCKLYYDDIVKRHYESAFAGLEASPNSHRYEIDGRWVNWDLLASVDTIATIESHIGRHKVYADLGAGWGRLGYVLRTWYPQCCYQVFDLPESLLISYSYLPNLLGEIGFLSHTPTIPGCYFAPSQDLLKVRDKSIDVLITIATFQEMTPEQVLAYVNIIKQKAKFLFVLQYGSVEQGIYEPLAKCKLLHHKTQPWSKQYFEALWKL